MAEIDGSNPLTPVWPQRPTRRIEQEEKTSEENRRRHQQRDRKEKDEDENDDDKPHIDEYV